MWSIWVESNTALGGFRVLKKTLESPYTTKVNYRDRTTRGTTLGLLREAFSFPHPYWLFVCLQTRSSPREWNSWWMGVSAGGVRDALAKLPPPIIRAVGSGQWAVGNGQWAVGSGQ